MELFYKFANSIRRIYWFVVRPNTIGVKCLVECDGEYLLIQTSYSGRYWTLPGGGVKKNEKPREAAKREVKEELGIGIETIQELGFYDSTAEYKKDTIYLFRAKTVSKDFKKNYEVRATQWFAKDKLPDQISRAIKEIIPSVRTRDLYMRLEDAPVQEKPEIFLEYCNECISQKSEGILRAEGVAYKITGCIFIKELNDIPEIGTVIDFASEMEIPREAHGGSGLGVSEKWTQEGAAVYKEKQYQELLVLIEKVRGKYLGSVEK